MGKKTSIREENEVLKGIVVKVVTAAVDPGAYTDLDAYVREIVEFIDVGMDDDEHVSQAEIDTLTSIVVEGLEFDEEGEEGEDEEDDDEEEDGEDEDDN